MHGQLDLWGETMKQDTSDYRIDFFDKEIEGPAAHTGLKEHALFEQARKFKQEFSYGNGNIVTSSPNMLRIIDIARQVSNADVPVLLLGESGVGKDVIAHFIHTQSNRFGNPFVTVNCAALPHELLESELFGYEKGAFTGAIHDRPGKFDLANTGTLFLDEIAEMTPSLQAKLLHVLQDGEFSRLGSKHSTKVDVRILAATNRKLKESVLKGEFRNDLYFRLNVIELQIPALRYRPADIPVLANHFLEKYRERYASSRHTFPTDVMEAFLEYEWPGNVRQLENVVKRYLILDDIEMDCELNVTTRVADPPNGFDLKKIGLRAADEAQRKIVIRFLDETGWNRKECAKRLHISYKAFRNKLKRWDLQRDHIPFARLSDQHSIASKEVC